MLVHRMTYADAYGPIPDGHVVGHVCHDIAVAAGTCIGGMGCPHRRCCNPAHLRAMTVADNNRAGSAANHPARTRRRAAKCGRGHAYAVYGGITPSTGRRYCKLCRRHSYDNLRATPEQIAAQNAKHSATRKSRAGDPKIAFYNSIYQLEHAAQAAALDAARLTAAYAARWAGFVPVLGDGLCWCGCGEAVTPGRRFRSGHDGQYRSKVRCGVLTARDETQAPCLCGCGLYPTKRSSRYMLAHGDCRFGRHISLCPESGVGHGQLVLPVRNIGTPEP